MKSTGNDNNLGECKKKPYLFHFLISLKDNSEFKTKISHFCVAYNIHRRKIYDNNNTKDRREVNQIIECAVPRFLYFI